VLDLGALAGALIGSYPVHGLRKHGGLQVLGRLRSDRKADDYSAAPYKRGGASPYRFIAVEE
jgi:hypothetical protein